MIVKNLILEPQKVIGSAAITNVHFLSTKCKPRSKWRVFHLLSLVIPYCGGNSVLGGSAGDKVDIQCRRYTDPEDLSDSSKLEGRSLSFSNRFQSTLALNFMRHDQKRILSTPTLHAPFDKYTVPVSVSLTPPTSPAAIPHPV
jgi:hypothetical protein